MNVKDIEVRKALGNFKPNLYLTNLSMAYFEDAATKYGHKSLFPTCPVDLSSGFYYTFSKADLARDNVHRKPAYGKVQPAVMGLSDATYQCKVDQIIIGLDQILVLNYQRTGAAGSADPRRGRVKTIVEQMTLHQEIEFARKFFKAGVWANEWTGAAATNEANKEFKKLDNSDIDPVAFFDARIIEIRRNGRRRPNKLALGVETFAALKNNPFIKDRIKYTGTTTNPAIVNETVLAQCFGVDEVVVLDATYNAAGVGEAENMQYVCDSKGALLMYSTDSPQIDEPSAGYTFTWDMLGNGNLIAIDLWQGNDGTHTDFMEGLIATDMRKTSDDLAIYFADCVG